MSAAGRALGSDVSTVSRRLAAVEKGLQTRLFIRGSQGYQPTDAGRVFMAHAEQAYGQVHAMLLATRSEADGIAGMVRLTAIDALFDHWLAARLPRVVAVPVTFVLVMFGWVLFRAESLTSAAFYFLSLIHI